MFARHRLLAVATLLVACHGSATDDPQAAADRQPAPPRVVFLGDSLTFGQGLASRAEAWPALVAESLAASGTPIEVINAGVSGDTTGGGLRRLPELLARQPDVVVVELGANDASHGLSATHARDNLRAIVTAARRAGARVLLVGLQFPTDLATHERAFARVWTDLARELDVPLVPDLMDGVFGVHGMVQSDGVHPTRAGQQRAAANAESGLRELVLQVLAAR